MAERNTQQNTTTTHSDTCAAHLTTLNPDKNASGKHEKTWKEMDWPELLVEAIIVWPIVISVGLFCLWLIILFLQQFFLFG